MTPLLGIFDSGLGGFTVLKRVQERHGNIPCLYLADTARVPYGEKKPYEIRAIANEVVNWLKEQEVSIVLVACNTTNSLALDVVKNVSEVNVVELINSAASMIVESRVGVLATPATASSKVYTDEIEAYRPGTFVLEQGCPALVPLIEAGHTNSNQIRLAASEYLKPLIEARVQAVVLGCSHYPLIKSLLRELLPSNVRLVDPAVGLALQLDKFLGAPAISFNPPLPFTNTRICVTSEPKAFFRTAETLLGNCPEVEIVSLRSKACLF